VSGAAVAALNWWRQRPGERFALRFLVLVLIAYVLTLALDPLMPTIGHATLVVVGWVSNLIGLGAQIESRSVLSFGGGAFSYMMTAECTALPVALLMTSAILAYPARPAQHWMGLLVGIPALFFLNLVRLVTLGWAGLRAPESYEVLHVFWWQALLILAVGLGWYAWARIVVHRKAPSPRTKELLNAVGIFVGVVVVLGVVGMQLSVIDAYGRVITAIGGNVLTALWGVVITGAQTSWFMIARGGYATLIAVIALFLATPRMAWKRRFTGAVLVGLPLLVAVDVVSMVVGFRVHQLGPNAPGGSHWIFSAHVVDIAEIMARPVLPVAAWFAWSRCSFDRTRSRVQKERCAVCGMLCSDALAHLERTHKRFLRAALAARDGLDHVETLTAGLTLSRDSQYRTQKEVADDRS